MSVIDTMLEPLRFRVYPDVRGGLFAYVFVFHAWKDFDWWSRQKWQLASTGRNYAGQRTRVLGRCVPYERRKSSNRLLPDFAEIGFCRKAIGTRIITHEVAHCTHAWARRKGLLVDGHGDDFDRMAREELWAYAHGEMCAQIVDRLYRERLLP